MFVTTSQWPNSVAQLVVTVLSEAKSLFCFLWFLESGHQFFVPPVVMFNLCRKRSTIHHTPHAMECRAEQPVKSTVKTTTARSALGKCRRQNNGRLFA